MEFVTRAARHEEFGAVRGVIDRAFPTEDEARLWDHLVAHDPALQPDCVRVATMDNQPVACVVALPREVRARTGLVPGAIVTLVACEPDYQGHGYGGAAVRDALAWMAARGLAHGVLYGHPTYYPRFGFVPVLPEWQTDLPVEPAPEPGAAAAESDAAPNTADLPTAPGLVAPLHESDDADLSDLSRLYVERVGTAPCSVARGTDAWLWRPRDPARHLILVAPDRASYAFVTPDAEHYALTVHEAAAADLAASRRLLAALQGEARTRGMARLRLAMPPDHTLVRLALLAGATQTYRPAGAGMAMITRWDRVLPPRYRVDDAGLWYGWIHMLRAGRRHLTELVLGYRSVDDLLLSPACALPDGDVGVHLAQLREDFPPLYPRWSLAPFWF